jgi:predicted RNA-binding Zn-ribbon protein involved in translation (DUF1610 family)
MGEAERYEVDFSRAEVRAGQVYIPCPACGKAVLISEPRRVQNDLPTYECPACGAHLVVE